jgi:hypothetical protein
MKDELQTVFEVIAGSPVIQGMRNSFQDEWLVHRAIVAAKHCLEHANPAIVAQKFASEFALTSIGDDAAIAFFVGQAANACERNKVSEFLAAFHEWNAIHEAVSSAKSEAIEATKNEDVAPVSEPEVAADAPAVVVPELAADVQNVELTVDSLALPQTIRKALKSNGLETVAQVEHQIANGGLEPLPLIGAAYAARIAEAVAKLKG